MIVGLSYLGDIRMGLAEDSKKVERIASSSSDGLKEAYLPLLEVSLLKFGHGYRLLLPHLIHYNTCVCLCMPDLQH